MSEIEDYLAFKPAPSSPNNTPPNLFKVTMSVYYMHRQNEALPAGCCCKLGAFSCLQCVGHLKISIQSMLLGPEQTPPGFDLNIYRIPNVVEYIVERLRHIETLLATPKTSPIQINKKKLKEAILKGLLLLIQIIANSVNSEERGIWYNYPSNFETEDGFVSATAENAVAVGGSVVAMVFRHLYSDSDITDPKRLQIDLTVFIFLVAYAARCQKITIPAFPDRAIPFLFEAYVNNVKHHRLEVSQLALFCIAHICKPDHQYDTLSSPCPVFRIAWKADSNQKALRFLSQGYIPVSPLMEKLCLTLKRPTLSEGELEAVLNIIHGVPSINLTVAHGILQHPELFDLLANRVLGGRSVEPGLFQTQLALFDEAIQSLYTNLDNVWDRGLLTLKVTRLLFHTNQQGQCPFLQASISAWACIINYKDSREVVAPMKKLPFTLNILRVFWGDIENAIKTPIWDYKRSNVVDGFTNLGAMAEVYGSTIDNTIRCIQGLDGCEPVVRDMDSKRAELKHTLGFSRKICQMFKMGRRHTRF